MINLYNMWMGNHLVTIWELWVKLKNYYYYYYYYHIYIEKESYAMMSLYSICMGNL